MLVGHMPENFDMTSQVVAYRITVKVVLELPVIDMPGMENPIGSMLWHKIPRIIIRMNIWPQLLLHSRHSIYGRHKS